jgi:hypothetical protein
MTERERERDLALIRSEFAFWGLDLSNVSDEDMERNAIEAQRVFATCGLSADAAADRAWTAVTRALNQR